MFWSAALRCPPSCPHPVVRRGVVAVCVISQWGDVTGEKNGTEEAAKW